MRCQSSSTSLTLCLVNAFLQDPPDFIIHGIDVRAVGQPQNWRDEVWHLSTEQVHSFSCSVSRSSILLKDEELGKLSHFWQQTSHQQLITVILATDLCSWINNVHTGTTKHRYDDWYHQWLAECCTGAQQTAEWNVFLQSSKRSIQKVVLGVGWRCNAEQLFISKPNKVYQRRRITFQQTLSWHRSHRASLLFLANSWALRLFRHLRCRFSLIIVLTYATDTPTWWAITLCVLQVHGPSSWLKVSSSTCWMWQSVHAVRGQLLPGWRANESVASVLRISFFRPSRVHPLLGNILSNCFAP